MKIYNYIIGIGMLALAAGCATPEEEAASLNQKVEIKTYLQAPEANTRVNLGGCAFESGDQITLYYGVPVKDHKLKGTYAYNGLTWTGTGLYWDDFARTTSNSFVGVANNATINLGEAEHTCEVKAEHTCEVKADQSTDAEYKASDLLVAYATSNKFEAVVLPFNHAFAHFVIKITDKTTEAEKPLILGANSEVTIKNIKRNSKITFDAVNLKTDVEVKVAEAAPSIKTRKLGKTSVDKNTYSYELILPAQSLASTVAGADPADIMLSIESKINGKTYEYNLSEADIKDDNNSVSTLKENMLSQGYTTTLNLSITKTDIGQITATLAPWVNTSASGEATPEDYPVLEIGNAADLNGIINKPGENFSGKTIKLTGNIDATDLSLPIGQCPNPFKGIFDGQGFSITNVVLDASSKTLPSFLGVFGCTEGATIMNLNVEGVQINNTNQSSSTATGALIGYAVDTKVLNCHVRGIATVEGTHDNVGGLIGYADGCTIALSSTTATVTGHHNYAGGLIGEALLTTVTASYATGDVTLCNKQTPATIEGYYVGGLVGYFYGSELTDCYAWGNAQCGSYAGGLLGGCGNVTIKSCYAAGQVSKEVGAGLIGIAERLEQNNVTHCYWNASGVIGSDDTQADGVNNGTAISNSVNSSFVLTATPVSMEPVLEGLNKTNNNAWELGTGSLTQQSQTKSYSLPVLLKNSGAATPSNLVVIEKQNQR